MMKKTKTALLLVLALVLMLQSMGMPEAKAEVINKLTVDYIFDGLGDALSYGIVAEKYTQANHAESSVFVDKLVKAADTPFLNTETTYMYGRAYPLYATVSAPSGKSLKGMQFALFTANGSEFTMCENTLTTIEDDTNVTAVGWRFDEDSPYLLHELYVRQVEKNSAGEYQIVKEGQRNSASLKVSYGPDISTAAPSSSYIGSMEVDMEVGSSIKFYNTMAHNPPIEFGPGARLCVKKYKYEWKQTGWHPSMGTWERVEDGYIDVTEGKNIRLNFGEEIDQNARVYIQYGEGRDKKYAQFEDKIRFEHSEGTMGYGYMDYEGSFYFEEGGKKNYLEITSTKEKDKAAKLLKKARAFSEELGNMDGGVVKYDPASGVSLINTEPSLLGNSTVTGPEDANGNVVSLYTVKLNDWKFDEKALQDSIGQQKILIAPNEYAVFNVICDEKTGYVDMLPNSLDMYIYEAGKADQAQWGKKDSGASDRVLFNFVYLDKKSGTYKPFEGTVNPASQHGGTVLAPSAYIEVLGDPPNGALVGKTISNSQGAEIHQRTMTSPAQTTWVNMVGDNAPKTGEIKLVKKQGTTLENLSGATFAVYSDKACTKKVGTDKTTDANGTVLFTELKPGTYYVKEVKAPAGYTLDSTVHTVEVYAGVTALVGTKGYVTNTSGRGTLTLTKVDAADANIKLSGAKFGLYTQAGNTFNASTAKLVQTLTTNSSGKITARVEAGTYWIKEIEAPFGYDLGMSQAKKITVKAGETTVVATGNGVVTNEKLPTGTLKVTKVDLDDSTKKLNDAEFAVYTNSECTRKVATFKTANGGTAEVELPVGTYWIKEIAAPNGYELDSATKHQVTIKAGKTTEMGEGGLVTNEITKAEAKLKKVTGVRDPWGNLQGAAEACSGAEFTVYNNSACGDEHIVASGLTDENGELIFKLAPGQYWIKETKAPIGYEIGNTAAKDFWVRLGETAKIPGDMYVNGESVFFNGRKSGTGDLVLYKVDAETKQKQLNGAEFMIYNDQDCTDPVTRQVFVTKDVGEHKGRLDIKGLEPGTYYLREEKAPSGYALPSPNLPIEVKIEQGKETRVNGAHGVVTNEAREVELIDIKVTKVWAGDEEVKGTVRPASITVTLLQGGVAHETVAVLNAANNWTFTWKDLPADMDGEKISYAIAENTVVPGYTTDYSGNETDGFVITNTYEEQGDDEVTALSFEKRWDDDNNAEGIRPASITVKLLANGVECDSATVSAADGWSWSWEDLPANDAQGKPISYTLKENRVPGYATSVKQAEGTPNAYIITNTLAKGECALEITKSLLGGADLPEGETRTFTFNLYEFDNGVKGDVAGSTTITLPYNGSVEDVLGTISFDAKYGEHYYLLAEEPGTDADIIYDSQQYKLMYYALVDQMPNGERPGELEMEDYAWEYYPAREDGAIPESLSFTNTYQKEETTYLNVRKIWEDHDNAAQERPASVTLVLLANGKTYASADVSESTGWEYRWENLPVKDAAGKAIEYSVSENPVPGYMFTVAQDAANRRDWTVVNIHTGGEDLGMLKLCKSDRLNPDKKLAGAQYTLFTQQTCKAEEILVLPDGTKAVITTGADGWGFLTGVPYGIYWVKETKAPVGYEIDPEPYKVELKAEDKEPAQVQVSDFPLRGALSLSKTVVADSKTGDSFLFDIVLSRNDDDPIAGSYEATLNGAAAEKVIFAADGKTAKATVSLKDGETLVIHGLRAGTAYVVTEQPNELYNVQVNGAAANAAAGTISDTKLAVAKFQNTLKLVSFSVKKEWSGLGEGEKTPAIKLMLYCNGKAYPAVTPAPDKNGWYTYTGLPAYVDGKLAVYTVKEEPVTGFKTTYLNKGENAAVTDCAHNGSTIVNSKIPQTGDSTPLTLWMLTALLAALGLAGVTVVRRKREN